MDLSEIRAGEASFGIAIGDRTCWGRGIGAAAGGLMLARAFNELGLKRVRAEVHETNMRSIALMRRLGFRRAGIAPELEPYQGQLVAVVLFVMEAQESQWFSSCEMLCYPTRTGKPVILMAVVE